MIKKNAVVLYKNQCAIVTDIEDEKYIINFCTSLATPSGKKAQYATVKVREKDIILLHCGPAENIDKIILFSDDKIKEQISETYSLLCSDETTSSEPISISDIAELMRTSFNVEECFAIYNALLESEEFSLDSDSMKNGNILFIPRTQEEIKLLQKKLYEKEHAVELRAEFIKRLKSKKIILPDDSAFMSEVESLALCQTEKSKVMKEAGFSETPEKAHKLLLDTGIWSIWRNPYPTRYGLSRVSAQVGLDVPPIEDRLELEEEAYAIDNEWSSDPDDAVSWDGKYLWVHVADPASSVLPDSEIDKVARSRGTTLYLPEGASRMLSEDCLADYALGLNEISYALSFRIKFDDVGAIEDCSVFKTKLKVKRMTYKQATEEKDEPHLKQLFEIAKRNIERREKAGALSVDLPEVHITVDTVNKLINIESENHYEANDMVKEMMLLAGEGVAHFAFKNNLPFPYISQEEPELPNDIPEGFAGEFRLLKCMRKRSVGIAPSPHAAIGVSMYTQVTSPLRRYGDLIAHEQLRAFIDGRKLIDKDEMLLRISAGDAASIAARKASRFSEMHWKLVYLLQNENWSGKAYCVDKKDKQVQLYIPSIDMQTYIVPTRKLALNDCITVKATNIDISTQSVNFIEV